MTITVTVNGRPHELPEGHTLATLVSALAHESPGLAADALATAVNGEFVPRTSRSAHALCDGDAVTCFQAITGG
jgi:sulfur carrier protein